MRFSLYSILYHRVGWYAWIVVPIQALLLKCIVSDLVSSLTKDSPASRLLDFLPYRLYGRHSRRGILSLLSQTSIARHSKFGIPSSFLQIRQSRILCHLLLHLLGVPPWEKAELGTIKLVVNVEPERRRQARQWHITWGRRSVRDQSGY